MSEPATRLINAPVAFADLAIGDEVRLVRRITAEQVEAFARLSGDYNPLHMEEEYARRTHFQRRVAHGMIAASYVSTMVGMQLPGPGALWTQQNFRWRAPVFIGDELTLTLRLTHKSEGTRTLTVAVHGINQHGATVLEGEGSVMVLEERKINIETPLDQRVALVTGSARGIGAAITQALAAAGTRVVVNYRRAAETADALCANIRAQGGEALAVQADVADPTAVRAMVEQAQQHFDHGIDILVNNAGGAVQHRDFLDTTWDEFQAHYDVQMRGAFNCCQAVLPGMLSAQSGCIVNIGSSYAWNVPPAKMPGYVAAKAALQALTRALAVELSPKGIRINMVSPGMTETELIAEVSERLRKVQAMQTPLRRLATPEDVASTVLFLCSDAARFMTGADLPVSGGASM